MTDKERSDFEFFKQLVANGEPTMFAFSKGAIENFTKMAAQEKSKADKMNEKSTAQKAVEWCSSLAKSIPVGTTIPMTLYLKDNQLPAYTEKQTQEHKAAAIKWLGRGS